MNYHGDLLYYSDAIRDSFVLDYDSQTVYINKKCGYDSNGNVVVLQQEETLEFAFPQIYLTDGDYTVEFLKYDNTRYSAYFMVRLMSANIYTSQFATKAEMNSNISQTATEINSSVDYKLTAYPTTTQMNSAINQKADEITSTVSATYATQDDLSTAQSQIRQTTDSISSTVSTKVGKSEVISSINQSSEAVTINANKISLAGKTINMTSDNIAINSTRFNVDKNGNLTCTNANISGTINANAGKIGNFNIDNGWLTATTEGIETQFNGNGFVIGTSNSILGNLQVYNSNTTLNLIRPDGRTSTAYIDYIYAQSYEIISLAEKKKNFELLKSGLDIIKNIDIYKYNYIQKDKNKKHIGVVIGDKYKYAEEITNADNSGIDLYNFVSVCCKAIQEQQEEIEQLQKEIEELKEGK